MQSIVDRTHLRLQSYPIRPSSLEESFEGDPRGDMCRFHDDFTHIFSRGQFCRGPSRLHRSGAWGIVEAFGFNHSLNHKVSAAKWFYAIYTFAHVGSAALVVSE